MALGAIDRAGSGLTLAQAKLATSASNSANLATAAWRRHRATGAEAADGGVETRVERAPAAGGDPVADAVERAGAAVLYRANLAVVRASDDMLGALLDVRG
jgi:flagellar basal body rod protein FlgC